MDKYNFIQKLIHYIFYFIKFLNRFIFDLECFIYLKKIKKYTNDPIFIIGLARARTTIIECFV